MDRIDVYPVGLLAALQEAWRILIRLRRPAKALQRVRWQVRYLVTQVRRGNWRAVKNTFNGYLAEPRTFPPGDYVRRCGTGWTKARALRSLERRLPA
jgi:hypothetical protein